jgi:hypothetical protein
VVTHTGMERSWQGRVNMRRHVGFAAGQSGASTFEEVGWMSHESLARSKVGAQAGVEGSTLGLADEAQRHLRVHTAVSVSLSVALPCTEGRGITGPNVPSCCRSKSLHAGNSGMGRMGRENMQPRRRWTPRSA